MGNYYCTNDVESVGANNGLDPNSTKKTQQSENNNKFQRKQQQRNAIPTTARKNPCNETEWNEQISNHYTH